MSRANHFLFMLFLWFNQGCVVFPAFASVLFVHDHSPIRDVSLEDTHTALTQNESSQTYQMFHRFSFAVPFVSFLKLGSWDWMQPCFSHSRERSRLSLSTPPSAVYSPHLLLLMTRSVEVEIMQMAFPWKSVSLSERCEPASLCNRVCGGPCGGLILKYWLVQHLLFQNKITDRRGWCGKKIITIFREPSFHDPCTCGFVMPKTDLQIKVICIWPILQWHWDILFGDGTPQCSLFHVFWSAGLRGGSACCLENTHFAVIG